MVSIKFWAFIGLFCVSSGAAQAQSQTDNHSPLPLTWENPCAAELNYGVVIPNQADPTLDSQLIVAARRTFSMRPLNVPTAQACTQTLYETAGNQPGMTFARLWLKTRGEQTADRAWQLRLSTFEHLGVPSPVGDQGPRCRLASEYLRSVGGSHVSVSRAAPRLEHNDIRAIADCMAAAEVGAAMYRQEHEGPRRRWLRTRVTFEDAWSKLEGTLAPMRSVHHRHRRQ